MKRSFAMFLRANRRPYGWLLFRCAFKDARRLPFHSLLLEEKVDAEQTDEVEIEETLLFVFSEGFRPQEPDCA